MPLAYGKERVGADDAEKMVARIQLMTQYSEGIYSVVRFAVGAGRVDERDFGSGLVPEGHARHGDTIGEAGEMHFLLEGLCCDGCDQYPIEGQLLPREARERDVSTMGRVEGSAEQGNTHGASIVSRGKGGYAECSTCNTGHLSDWARM